MILHHADLILGVMTQSTLPSFQPVYVAGPNCRCWRGGVAHFSSLILATPRPSVPVLSKSPERSVSAWLSSLRNPFGFVFRTKQHCLHHLFTHALIYTTNCTDYTHHGLFILNERDELKLSLIIGICVHLFWHGCSAQFVTLKSGEKNTHNFLLNN